MKDASLSRANREAIGPVQISNCCSEANQYAVDSLPNTR